MAIVCIFLGMGLSVVAWNSRRDVDWLFPAGLLLFAILNFGGAMHMIATDFEYAFKLAPNPHNR